MVKRREPQATAARREPTAEQIEAFAAAADGGSVKSTSVTPSKPALDPNANRDYKAIRVPFNEFEFSKKDFIFLDPPYDTDFSDYEKKSFDKKDQERLAKCLYKTKANFILIIKKTDFTSLHKTEKALHRSINMQSSK